MTAGDVCDAVGDLLQSEKREISELAWLLQSGEFSLFVADNLEQLDRAALDALRTITEGTPVLATSRGPTGLVNEACVPVPLLEAGPAAQMFVEMAQFADPSVVLGPEVAHIVALLGGLPLMLALAAKGVQRFDLPHLYTALQNSVLDFTDPAARNERHASITAAVTWSLDLVGEHDREVFAALGTFATTCRRVDVTAFGDDALAALDRLTHAGLVRQQNGGVALLGPVAVVAKTQLQNHPKRQVFAQALADLFTTRVADLDMKTLVGGPHMAPDDVLNAEAVMASASAPNTLAVWMIWRVGLTDRRFARWLKMGLQADGRARGLALARAGLAAHYLGSGDEALDHFTLGEAVASSDLRSWFVVSRIIMQFYLQRSPELMGELDDEIDRLRNLHQPHALGFALMMKSRFTASFALAHESVEVMEAAGLVSTTALRQRARMHFANGRLDEALADYERAAELAERRGWRRDWALSMVGVYHVCVHMLDDVRAEQVEKALQQHWEDLATGVQRDLSESRARRLLQQDDAAGVRKHIAQILAAAPHNPRHHAEGQVICAELLCGLGDHAEALAMASEVLTDTLERGFATENAYARLVISAAKVGLGQLEAARGLLNELIAELPVWRTPMLVLLGARTAAALGMVTEAREILRELDDAIPLYAKEKTHIEGLLGGPT